MVGFIQLKRLWFWVGFVVLSTTLLSCVVIPANVPVIALSTTGEGNRVGLHTDHETTQIEIFSERGVGSADIQFVAGPYPKQIVLRFHLRGLEQLRLTYGNITLVASVSSLGDHEIYQEISKGNDKPSSPQLLSPDLPEWMNISLVTPDGDTNPQIPLQNGYIDVELSGHFLEQQARTFSVQWIDFLR